jgi:8-oxo-dGTP pyrophosphatase MutT (NUDIX family)
MSTTLPALNNQVAALPWRLRDGELEVLLITTRNTRRWIVPKGWPGADLSPSESAAREALEEAGVTGAIVQKPLGRFHYTKQRRTGERLPVSVAVFPLEVMRQRRTFPEKHLRETRWCKLDEALAHISEPGLKRLITKFAKEAAVAA